MSLKKKYGILALLGGALCSPLTSQAIAAPEKVDLELVLATDVSRSIDQEEAALQRDGTAAAFRSPEVIKAIQAGNLGKIAVAYIDWSVDGLNRVVIDWRVIHDRASAERFADDLLNAPTTEGNRTSISSALVMAADMIETNNYDGTQKDIDVSGDGKNNAGLELGPVRDMTVAKGITINGLPIVTEGGGFGRGGFVPDLDKYYAACVIGGRGAFAVVARGFQDFSIAIRHKLILEVSNIDPEIYQARQGKVVKVAARPLFAQLPRPPGTQAPPTILRPPAVHEQNCDQMTPYGGFGGFGGFDNFGRP